MMSGGGYMVYLSGFYFLLMKAFSYWYFRNDPAISSVCLSDEIEKGIYLYLE